MTDFGHEEPFANGRFGAVPLLKDGYSGHCASMRHNDLVYPPSVRSTLRPRATAS
jgi:hypothetical protein